ncbi:MAG: hypothetical protein A2664_03565 [Candidatus Taylorbacteria bacterium RIFCSPHIGHO2_01_FULL_46_22b]|uniref:Uncharacterized protein n=1 Tax=Candidatus Taylorbacteria bacterium RIFCSPHIGHO2_01_FULL_46_22b TaxID=1802301 RepID=A0A1G2M1A4_9BACT|nr:MAG: hypothetical protein A2664_03565 [Candidatus Taylorbacteria bacterium RIFCSPHIGHO2_01_FULL_46_22b]
MKTTPSALLCLTGALLLFSALFLLVLEFHLKHEHPEAYEKYSRFTPLAMGKIVGILLLWSTVDL